MTVIGATSSTHLQLASPPACGSRKPTPRKTPPALHACRSPRIRVGSLDLAAYGAPGITIDGTGWTPHKIDRLSSMMGNVADDPRAAVMDGRILLGTDGTTLADGGTLQLLYSEGTVTILASGVMLESVAG